MELFLRSAWNDLQKHLGNHFTPLGVVELVNWFPGTGNWRFQTTQQSDGKFRLDIHVVGDLNWETNVPNILSGSNPHLFYCSEIQIKSGNEVLSTKLNGDLFQYHSQGNVLRLSKIREWDQTQPHVSLIGFGQGILHPELSSNKTVEDFVRSNTWVGNSEFRNSNCAFKWKVLASDVLDINPRTKPTPYGVAELIRGYEQSGLKITIAFLPQFLSGAYRIQGANFSRELTRLPLKNDPIRKALSELGGDLNRDYCMILESTELLSLNGLGDIDFSNDFCSVYASFAEHIRDDLELKNYSNKKITAKNEIEAQKLNNRQSNAQTDPKVAFEDLELLNEPQSELGVVSLFSKLEALGKLPFQEFKLREITPDGHGIDALADYRLHANGHLSILTPLEFEYEFVNFIRHGHEKPQVDLIVCWRLGTNMPDKYDLEPTEYPWLYRLPSVDSKTISVVVLKEITGLTLSR